jgi:Predicted hydrolase of the alpha/beta superfamily
MKRFFSLKHLLLIAVSLAVLLCAPPARAQNEAPMRLVIKSETLNEERVILVRTPPGYERNQERYPVLYLTDGDGHLAHTAATLSFLARNARIPEMIIVGITNTDRTRDLTPTNASIQLPDGRTQAFPTSGGADKFLKFIETELIPHIEGKYRVQPYRIFAGHSFGGLFAIHAMIARPELFNAYIAASPSLQWDNQATLKRAEEFLKARKDFKKTLFVSLGNEPGDITTGFNRFREFLTKNPVKDFEWAAEHMEDEDHGSIVLRSHYQGLRKVFAGWQLPRDPETGAFAGGLAGVEEHYKKLTQKYGYTILPPEALVNFVGYQLMGGGRIEEAIAAFKSNAERYPNSANVYDSLAEAYETSGRLDLAKPNYEKAYTLGKQNNDPNTEIFKTNLDRVTTKTKQDTGAKTGGTRQ